MPDNGLFSLKMIIPEARRPTHLFLDNQDDEISGVFRLTERVVLHPRRYRKPLIVGAWKKSSVSRGLAEPTLMNTMTFPQGKKCDQIQIPVLVSTPEVQEHVPVALLTPSHKMVVPQTNRPWTKYIDNAFLSKNSTEAIIDMIWHEDEKLHVRERQTKFASRFRFRRSRKVQDASSLTRSSVPSLSICSSTNSFWQT